MSGKSSAPLANTNAVRHGLYWAKFKDPIKTQRVRRRLQDVLSEVRPIIRPVTVALVETEDRLAR